MLQTKHIPDTGETVNVPASPLDRRNFLSKMMGAAAITAVAASCTKSITGADEMQADMLSQSKAGLSSGTVYLGYSDYAVLNYAYILEQLEAQFYTMVTENYFSGATDWQKKRLAQIRDHEIAHREFFKTALGKYAVPSIKFNLNSIDFTSGTSVLGTAQAFEDLGVSAYNGAGKYIKNPDYLTVAGKIVSVEARHAAYIRDLVNPGSFADATVISSQGLDKASSPRQVIPNLLPYLPVKLDTSKAPW